MIKLIHLNYYFHKEFNQPAEVISKHKLASGFVKPLNKLVDLCSVKHLNYEGQHTIDSIRYVFFRSNNKAWHIPFSTHRFIKNQKPDIILIEGFIFPFQVIHLRRIVGEYPVIIVQHHGEKPFKGLKGVFQRLADRSINGYIFTSLGNAQDWILKKVIKSVDKCYEVLSASTDFVRADKEASKYTLGFTGTYNFLWVARLNSNKDPLTILQAFKNYRETNKMAMLYMIYQAEDLLDEIKALLSQNTLLKSGVVLVGKIDHNRLSTWYNAADFYISGSHNEGSGYALVEAMSCGCIPLVTNIPSFNKITDQGKYAMLFTPGQPAELFSNLLKLKTINREKVIAEMIEYSKNSLSFEAIAMQIYQLSLGLLRK